MEIVRANSISECDMSDATSNMSKGGTAPFAPQRPYGLDIYVQLFSIESLFTQERARYL
jgi:hypothetical protein